eukprot:m.73535 g.73535  ORF g.73535 m.73535 type:complete len:216 (+) comp16124_c0_seq14:1825-2472(+)
MLLVSSSSSSEMALSCAIFSLITGKNSRTVSFCGSMVRIRSQSACATTNCFDMTAPRNSDIRSTGAEYVAQGTAAVCSGAALLASVVFMLPGRRAAGAPALDPEEGRVLRAANPEESPPCALWRTDDRVGDALDTPTLRTESPPDEALSAVRLRISLWLGRRSPDEFLGRTTRVGGGGILCAWGTGIPEIFSDAHAGALKLSSILFYSHVPHYKS